MNKIFKVVVSVFFLTIFSFGVGIFFGSFQIASADACDGEDSTLEIVQSIIMGKSVSACTNDVYMGGLWRTTSIPVNKTYLDSSTISGYITETLSHYNNNQSYRSLYFTTDTLTFGGINVHDENLPNETYNAVAVNSWKGGWPIDTYYDTSSAIKIVVNTAPGFFWTGDPTIEKATLRHEFGHSLGLGHRTDISTLMYCSRSRTATGLTSKDKEILDVIY